MPTNDPFNGSGWDTNSPDVDQIHGNTYKEIQDLRKGVGIRLNKEHVACASASAGGEHQGGKCGITLVMDNTADFSAYVDATTCPKGSLAYCISYKSLWCVTKDASAGVPDITCMGFLAAQKMDVSTDCLPQYRDGTLVWGTADGTNGAFLDYDDMSTSMADRICSQQSVAQYARLKVTAKTGTTDHTLDDKHLTGHYMFTNTGAATDVTIYIGNGVAGQKAFFSVDVTANYLKCCISGGSHFRAGDITSPDNGYVRSNNRGATWSAAYNGAEWIIGDVVGAVKVSE